MASYSFSSRPHKPEPGLATSTKRLVWEWLHKLSGRLTLVLALVNITLGLFLGLASVALWATWLVYLGLIVVSYVIGEVALKGQKSKASSHDFQMMDK